jgi:hypothetical protein
MMAKGIDQQIKAAMAKKVVGQTTEIYKGVVLELYNRRCQLIAANTVLRQTGMRPRSFLPFRQPAPYSRSQPNSRIDGSFLDGMPRLTAGAVAGGSVVQWDHMPRGNAVRGPAT